MIAVTTNEDDTLKRKLKETEIGRGVYVTYEVMMRRACLYNI